MVNYTVGDFLIRIKNAAMAGRREVEVPSTKLVRSVAEALKRERYLNEIKEKDGCLSVGLTFHKKEPILFNMKVVSKPGLRRYMNIDQLSKHRGASTYIISTSKGVLSLKEAMKEGVGGEVIAEVW